MTGKNRFERDLDSLINKGEMLGLSMRLDCYGKDFEIKYFRKWKTTRRLRI